MDNFIDPYGMVNSKVGEQYAENSILWTLQLVFLLRESGRFAESLALAEKLCKVIENCRIKEGLFHQNPIHHERDYVQKDGYMSPDQLITIFLTGYLYSSAFSRPAWHKEIWQEIINQGGYKYNNLEDSELRLIHPRDLVLYKACVRPVIGQIALFVLLIANIVACLSKPEKTSGKLLAWTKMMALKDHFLTMKLSWIICSFIIKKKHGNWADVFKIYFPVEGHPNAELAQEIYEIH
jgi:hypothetical protein